MYAGPAAAFDHRGPDCNLIPQALNQTDISQSSGKSYLNYLQRLCGASGVLPASFMLTDGFDHIDQRPFASGGFADVYKATYKGQLVVAKALKTASVNDLENVHKVSITFCLVVPPIRCSHRISSVLQRRS